MYVKLRARGISSSRLLPGVFSVLRRTTLWSMATVGPNGEPHINTAYFSYTKQLDFFFLSNPSTKHIEHLRNSDRVAVAVFDSHQAWDASHRGLQLFGPCRSVADNQLAVVHKVHSARFPAYGAYVRGLSPEEKRSSPYQFFVFRAQEVKICDEELLGEEVFVRATIVRGR